MSKNAFLADESCSTCRCTRSSSTQLGANLSHLHCWIVFDLLNSALFFGLRQRFHLKIGQFQEKRYELKYSNEIMDIKYEIH